MKAKLICGIALACLALISCNKNEMKQEEGLPDMVMTEGEKQKSFEQQPPEEPQQSSVQYDSAPPVKKPLPTIDWNKKIIKNATVKLEVKNQKIYNDGLHEKISKHGGYIAQEDNFFTDDRSESVVSIKVPVDQFEDLLDDLGGADVKVIERSIRSEDVTGQVVDTKSRLEAKKQMRLKYLEFLKQSKNMAEVLQVQAEINGIQEEIEAASGRIAYLTNQSAYSTIHLTFYEPLPGFAGPEITPGFFTKAVAAFKSGMEVIKSLTLGLISIWPLVLLLSGVIYLWRKKIGGRVQPAKA
jgi:hypothetical protein